MLFFVFFHCFSLLFHCFFLLFLLFRCFFAASSRVWLKRPCSRSRFKTEADDPKFGVYIIYIYIHDRFACFMILRKKQTDKQTRPFGVIYSQLTNSLTHSCMHQSIPISLPLILMIRTHAFRSSHTPLRLAAHRRVNMLTLDFELVYFEYTNLIILALIEQITGFQKSSRSCSLIQNWILCFMLKLKGFDDLKFWSSSKSKLKLLLSGSWRTSKFQIIKTFQLQHET